MIKSRRGSAVRYRAGRSYGIGEVLTVFDDGMAIILTKSGKRIKRRLTALTRARKDEDKIKTCVIGENGLPVLAREATND